MITVNIIGSGNIAQHLITNFENSDTVILKQVYARNSNALPSNLHTSKIITDITHLTLADVCIIAVSDSAIQEVSEKLPFTNQFVVHTSGTMPMQCIKGKNRKGVFYPLQTFSKNKEVDFKTVPICLETESETDYKILEKLAFSLSEKVYSISSEQRKSLHIAAVFVCNFVNHLYRIGNDICVENNIPFEILLPLIEETASKIEYLTPSEAQTGPAIRNDNNTINKHLEMLNDITKKEIYTLLTQSIQKDANKKL